MNDRDQSHARAADGRGALAGHATEAVARMLDRFGDRIELSVLEIGCGSTANLAAAAARGWRCFGVEAADQARSAAQRQLGEAAHIVKSISDLFACKFDLVLMSDVIERYPSPYHPFYELFALGAIAPDTVLMVTTPDANVGATDSLTLLLRRLRFTEVEVRSLAPAGLVATAKGSDFQTFMQERYVPGTWSKIAAYEHMPRYGLAKTLAAGKTVLDFGCGTGYGAAILANVAKDVTGLDIDESALTWARQTHHASNLAFRRHDDLGATLPAASFDLVTCFEMIEHVDHATQQRAVASIARLLRDDGLLMISTPNPDVTKLYGDNPYHLREMSEAEFRDLLRPCFTHIRMLRQHVRPGVTFGEGEGQDTLRASSMDAVQVQEPPMAFVALCGRRPIADLPHYVFFDDASNYVGEFIGREHDIQVARSEAYRQGVRARAAETQYRIVAAARNDAVIPMQQAIQAREETQHQLNLKTAELETLRRTREDEMRSLRFLAKHLWRAMCARLWRGAKG